MKTGQAVPSKAAPTAPITSIPTSVISEAVTAAARPATWPSRSSAMALKLP